MKLLERPVDDISDLADDVRCCDSRIIDKRVRPWKILSVCPRPAEWIYIMRCCGGQALACEPCHKKHLVPLPSNYHRHCIHCDYEFSTIVDGTTAVYRV